MLPRDLAFVYSLLLVSVLGGGAGVKTKFIVAFIMSAFNYLMTLYQVFEAENKTLGGGEQNIGSQNVIGSTPSLF